LTDSELLERYVSQKDAVAFEVLVWRHGGMVLGLCRRLLRDEHEAEDAFQATFLVLSKKAGSVGRGEAVGAWLYKVAYRVALRLRNAAAKRPASTELASEPAAPEASGDAAWQELRPVLDSEIAGLPEKYRAPFVLCYLQGRTNEEAAQQLGCPKGTILSRLSRGREWLRARLTRRGLAPAAVALALNLPATASAAVPGALAQSTTAAAIPFAAGTATGLVSPPIAALAEGAIRAMFVTKLKTAAAGLLALAVLGSGVVWTAFAQAREERKPAEPAARGAAPQERERPANADRGAPEAGQPPRDVKPAFQGKVVVVAKDGKSFTVQVGGVREIGQSRAEPERVTVKLTDQTGQLYNGVAFNGATPTVGYTAVVWLADDSKDTATFVTFSGTQGSIRKADVAGVVTEVAKDGKSIVVSIPPGRDAGRDTEPMKVTITFDSKAQVTFTNVNKGGATPTVGQQVAAWNNDDGKGFAKVVLLGEGEPGRRDEKRPEVTGKVVASVENKSITIEVPPTERGAEPTRTEIKLTEQSVLNFQNVLRDGAKVSEGMNAMVWLADNSKDTAAKVYLMGNVAERWTIVQGKVVSVGKDGNSFTVETPAANPRTDEPTRTEIKLTPKTQAVFYGVGAGEAKLAEGLFAQVRLLDGSKDTAAQVTFSKAGAGRR
jgi:RNA polymerase sigma factor (sigma-70 family)